MTVIADTLQAKKRLIEAGFSDEKAEGIVAIFREADTQLATKLDLELYRKDTKGEFEKVDEKIERLRKDTKAEFEKVDARFEQLEERIGRLGDELLLKLTIRMGGIMVAGIGVLKFIL